MKINIDKLLVSRDKLIELLNNYEQIYNNFYHEIENVKNYWHDSHANYFFGSVVEEKKENIVFFEEFNSIVDIYSYIVNKYQYIGNNIEVDLNNRDDFIVKMDNCITGIDDIINMYRSLDSRFLMEVNKSLLDEEDKCSKIRNRLLSIKESNKRCLNEVEEIERQISLKISKINIVTVKENNYKNDSLGQVDDKYMDVDNVDIITKKLQFNLKEEEINYEDVSKIFSSINYFYNTNNKSDLDNLIMEILYKFKSIINIHRNRISILELNKNNYQDTLSLVKNFFSEEL